MSEQKIQQTLKLWDNQSLVESNGITDPEKYEDGIIKNVSESTITIYSPDNNRNTHAAVIICPGGAYMKLAIDHEGHQFAKWLQQRGITGIVLKYRLPNGHKNIPFADIRQAINHIRSNSQKYNIDPHKIGVAGFSAGGHLAAMASTIRKEERTILPNFSILCYPVITLENLNRDVCTINLLGNNPLPHEVSSFSIDRQVTADTPPAILFHSDDDKLVPTCNSLKYYQALKQKGIQSSLHIFPEGGHGWGMKATFPYHQQWLDLLDKWLNKIV